MDPSELAAMLHNLQEQLTSQAQASQAQFQALQSIIAKQNETIETMSEQIATIKSAPISQPEVTLTPPESNAPQALPIESKTGFPAVPSTTILSPSPPSTKTRPELSERLPDITEFTGKRNQLPLWKAALANKLGGNHDRYPTELAKLTYARARIAGEPAVTLSRLNHDFPTLQSLIAWLDKQYGDPNERVNAELKLRDLRQGNRPFWKFFTEFRTLASKAEAAEGAQYMLLKGAISPELQRLMITQTEADCLTDYVNTVAKIDEQLRFINGSSRTQHARTVIRNPDAMDIDNLEYAPVGSVERERRLKKGLCFKCGSSKHISPDCKKTLPKRSDSARRSRSVNAVSPNTRSNTNSPPRRPGSRRSRRSRSRTHSASTSSSRSEQSKGRSRN